RHCRKIVINLSERESHLFDLRRSLGIANLRLHCRQRRPELMSGTVEETPLPFMQLAQTIHMIVQGLHQRPNLALHLIGVQRIQTVRRAVANLLPESEQRPQLPRNTEPDRNRSGDDEDTLLEKAPYPQRQHQSIASLER